MSASDPRQKELEDIELKLHNARQAAAAPDASERDKSDLKLIEQEYLAAQQKARRAPEGASKPDEQPSDPRKKLDKKLDTALKDTFPSSDPVAIAEPTPVKDQDRALPEVKASEQQAPEKAKAARKTKAKTK
jgi:hypothetical protein